MQGVRGAASFVRRAWIIAACAAFIALCTCLFASPRTAFASDEYAITSVEINAEAQTDASLHVIEVRTFELGKNLTKLSWLAYDPFPDNATLKVNSVRIGWLNDNGELDENGMMTVDEVDVNFSLNKTIRNVSWSFDRAWHYLDLRLAQRGGNQKTLVVEFDYTVVNGVQLYKDCAEIDWKYVNEAWLAESENVHMRLTLPVPNGVEAVEGSNVYVWGHGPQDGTISDIQDGSVTFDVSKVNADAYAEVRLICPTDWFPYVTNKDATLHTDSVHLDWALEQETDWTDRSRVRAKQADVTNGVVALACIAVVLASLVVCLVKGRGRKPREVGENPFEFEVLTLAPALFGRLARWNRRNDADLIATLQSLHERGAIEVHRPDDEAALDQLTIVCCPLEGEAADSLDDIDREVLALLNGMREEGSTEVSVAALKEFARANPDQFIAAMNDWSEHLSLRVKKFGIFDVATQKWARALRVVALIMALLALCSASVGEDASMAILLLLSAAVVCLLSYYTKRLTQTSLDMHAEQAALHKVFSDLDSKTAAQGTAAQWSRLLNRAYLLDVLAPAVESLRAVRPELFEKDAADASVAWFEWFDHTTRSSVVVELGAALDEAYKIARDAKSSADAEVRLFRKIRAKFKGAQS